ARPAARLELDIVRDEADRTIAQGEVGATHVQAGKSFVTARARCRVPHDWRIGRVQANTHIRRNIVKSFFGIDGWTSHADPRAGATYLRIPLTKHERIAQSVCDVVHLLPK